ncbi:glycoprotein hormone beta-5 isoform 2-T3 [Spinachia spinachia]
MSVNKRGDSSSANQANGAETSRRPGLLLLLVLWASLMPDFPPPHRTEAVKLRHFIGCAVREFTFLARKPGCGGVRVTTDACWGRCETWEKPVLDPPHIESHQRVCTYNQTRLASVRLPGCLPGVDPSFSYPVALRCACAVCATSSTECVTSV